jgi:hypothetical protein
MDWTLPWEHAPGAAAPSLLQQSFPGHEDHPDHHVYDPYGDEWPAEHALAAAAAAGDVGLGPERRGPRLARCWEGGECVRLLRLLRFQRDGLARRAGGAAPGGDAARRRREAVGAAGELVVEAETRYVEVQLARPRDGEKVVYGVEDMKEAKKAFEEALDSYRQAMVKAALGMQAVTRAGAWWPTGLVYRLHCMFERQWIELAAVEMRNFKELAFAALAEPLSFASSFARSYNAVLRATEQPQAGNRGQRTGQHRLTSVGPRSRDGILS